MGSSYIFGGGDWQPEFRDKQAKNILSSDPVRSAVHNAWCLQDPALQVGNITFGWLHEALESCRLLNAPGAAQTIATPCLIGIAGRDRLVDNGAILPLRPPPVRRPHPRIARLQPRNPDGAGRYPR